MGVAVGSGVALGRGVALGSGVTLGKGVALGSGVALGRGVFVFTAVALAVTVGGRVATAIRVGKPAGVTSALPSMLPRAGSTRTGSGRPAEPQRACLNSEIDRGRAGANGPARHSGIRHALSLSHVRFDEPDTRPGLCRPAWWAPHGVAAIPTAALDPPHSAASPAVPALIGSGSPSIGSGVRAANHFAGFKPAILLTFLCEQSGCTQPLLGFTRISSIVLLSTSISIRYDRSSSAGLCRCTRAA